MCRRCRPSAHPEWAGAHRHWGLSSHCGRCRGDSPLHRSRPKSSTIYGSSGFRPRRRAQRRRRLPAQQPEFSVPHCAPAPSHATDRQAGPWHACSPAAPDLLPAVALLWGYRCRAATYNSTLRATPPPPLRRPPAANAPATQNSLSHSRSRPSSHVTWRSRPLPPANARKHRRLAAADGLTTTTHSNPEFNARRNHLLIPSFEFSAHLTPLDVKLAIITAVAARSLPNAAQNGPTPGAAGLTAAQCRIDRPGRHLPLPPPPQPPVGVGQLPAARPPLRIGRSRLRLPVRRLRRIRLRRPRRARRPARRARQSAPRRTPR